MKQSWEIKKLGDVCKVIAGQSPEGKYYNSDGKGMPFYQGKKEYGEKYIGGCLDVIKFICALSLKSVILLDDFSLLESLG